MVQAEAVRSHTDPSRRAWAFSMSELLLEPRLKERARNKLPICGPVVSERFFCLTPEGSRSIARGILPLEGICATTTTDLRPGWGVAERDVRPLIQGGKAAPDCETCAPSGGGHESRSHSNQEVVSVAFPKAEH